LRAPPAPEYGRRDWHGKRKGRGRGATPRQGRTPMFEKPRTTAPVAPRLLRRAPNRPARNAQALAGAGFGFESRGFSGRDGFPPRPIDLERRARFSRFDA
jgi:hypothetical protein